MLFRSKSPKIKNPIDQAIEQHLRNQQEDGIRSLYYYSNIVMGVAVNEARYGTTATSKEFWSVWKEQFRNKEEEEKWIQELQQIKNEILPDNDRTVLFKERFRYVLQYFDKLEEEDLTITEQDKLLYNVCRKDRLLDIMYHFILFDDGKVFLF